jgi:hypothetical protein
MDNSILIIADNWFLAILASIDVQSSSEKSDILGDGLTEETMALYSCSSSRLRRLVILAWYSGFSYQ